MYDVGSTTFAMTGIVAILVRNFARRTLANPRLLSIPSILRETGRKTRERNPLHEMCEIRFEVGPLWRNHIDKIRPRDHACCIDSLGTGGKALDELIFTENTSFASEDSHWDFDGVLQTERATPNFPDCDVPKSKIKPCETICSLSIFTQ